MLIDKGWREDYLAEAWRRVRRNDGAAGVDAETFADIESYGVRRWLREARFTMRDHHATEEEALAAVNRYIAAWEFEAALVHGPNRFRLRFDYPDIEDWDPPTGKVFLRPKPT